MEETKNTYRIHWVGTADVVDGHPAETTFRTPMNGWLEIELESDEEAQELAVFNSDTLLDVDFISPGDHYSASNGDVTQGAYYFPDYPDSEPTDWTFHHATVIRIDKRSGWEPVAISN